MLVVTDPSPHGWSSFSVEMAHHRRRQLNSGFKVGQIDGN